ncbi:hypothetical protein KFE25_008849 [Diacronema lutheri]|uniref:SET domain-containing protein n=1 Tax=Diacronema lutheri TaxID=2081491 RepID=A0A8J5XRL2_DIALT|nr:hypothetical protein KFE25_008849 [Diacronema lutheri]
MADDGVAAVEPFDFPETGRGQRTVRAIRAGETVLAVPLDECWTVSAARAALGQAHAPVLAALDRLPAPRVLKTPLLALHLLIERARGAGSPHHAHIQVLPREFDSPLHWTDDELAALHASPSGWRAFAERARDEAARDYGELVEELGEAMLDALNADYASYLWASSAFQSRLMDVHGAEPLMAPGLDLFNHTADPLAGGSFGLDPHTGRHVRVTAYRDYALGEQVFISYGRHSNGRLLFSYGFALGIGSNPYDQVELTDALPFGPACSDEASRLRSALALRAAMPFAAAFDEPHGSAPSGAPPPVALDIPSVSELVSDDERRAMRLVLRHALSLAAPLPTPLLVSARLAQLTDAELRALNAMPAAFDALTRGMPVSTANERAAVDSLRAQLGALAQRGSTRAAPVAAVAAIAATAAESARGARRAAAARLLVGGERSILAATTRALDAKAAAAASASISPLLPQLGAASAHLPPAAPAGSSRALALAAASASASASASAYIEHVPLGRAAEWADAPKLPGAGRMLVCTRAIAAGELLWSVPLSRCYGADDGAGDALLVTALGAGAATIPRRAFAPLLIAWEQQAGSGVAEAAERVAAATRLGHRLEHSAPLCAWARGEQAQLRGSRWLAELDDAALEVGEDWETLRGVLAQTAEGQRALEHGWLSEARYKAARAIWHAGAVDARAEGGWAMPLLVPALTDGCTHDAALPHGSSLTIERDSAGTPHACVRALCPLDARSAVRVRFGYESNGELALRRGFALAPNAHDRVELSLTVHCTARTLQAAMLAAPEAPIDLVAPSPFEFVRVPTDGDAQAAGEAGAPLVTRHSVSAAQPLPLALLALLRLERLTTDELGAVEAGLARQGQPLWAQLQSGVPLSATNELHALHAAEAIALEHLRAYTPEARRVGTAHPEQPHDGGPPAILWCSTEAERTAVADAVVGAEVGALRALAADAHARRRTLVEGFLQRMHTLPGKKADEASPWGRLLRTSRPRLDKMSSQVGVTTARLLAAVEAASSHPAAPTAGCALEAHLLLAHVCSSSFGWLMGCAPEPRAPAYAAPLCAGSYAALFAAKVRLWGCFLLAQWAEATTLGLSELNAMLMESVDLRSRHAWSVPSVRALGVLGTLGPLALAGDANGTWLAELRARGVDVEPSELAARPDDGRALVVCWADVRGVGAVGVELVRAFGGRVLATIGEWRGHTYGAYSDGLGEHGQSFSTECQRLVEETFELREHTQLPNWPLMRDALLIWERRDAEGVGVR